MSARTSCKQIGVRVPEGGLTTTVEHALEIAASDRLPGRAQGAGRSPVAQERHAGGVILNLADEAQLRRVGRC
jgi:hypothetical protein